MKSTFDKLALKNTTEKVEKNVIQQQMTSTANYIDSTTVISAFKSATVKRSGKK